jgi:hypothetical protein
VRWWSYYDPRWASFGLWHIGAHYSGYSRRAPDDAALVEAGRTTGTLSLLDIRVLQFDDPAVVKAARTRAPIVPSRR